MNPQAKLKQLNNVLAHSRFATFYQERIPEKPLTSLEQVKQIPLTTKADLRHHSPFGLITVDRKKLLQYHESSGTTGTPVSVWFSRKDIDEISHKIAKHCNFLFTKHDTLLVRFPYALSTIAHFTHDAAMHNHTCVISADSRTTITPMPRVIDMMQRLEVTILACNSLQAVMLAEMAEILGYTPKSDFPHLRAICTAGEPLTATRRKLLEDIWRVPVFDNYGMTETCTMMVDCEHHRLHPFDDYFLFELLDDTLQTEVTPGEIGHLVVTTLRKRTTPMIRYLTGDRVRYVPDECPCGKYGSLEIRGRADDTLPVNKKGFDMWDFDEIVSHLPCRRFWVVGPAPAGLHFVIEAEANSTEKVAPELVDQLEQKYGIDLIFEIVPKGTLYDRSEPLSFGMKGKPKYVYTAEEMALQKYESKANA